MYKIISRLINFETKSKQQRVKKSNILILIIIPFQVHNFYWKIISNMPRGPKRASPTVAKSNAKKAKGSQKPKYFAFTLTNGKVEYIESAAEAKEFVNENEPIIAKRDAFVLKKDYVAFKAQKNAIPSLPTAAKNKDSPSLQKMTPKQKMELERVLQKIDLDRPSDRIEVHWKTTTKASACCFVVRFLTTQGQEVWCIKGDMFALAVSKYVSIFKQESIHVTQALKNMVAGKMRDPSGDPDAIFKKTWTSPTTNKQRSFEIYLAYGYFFIPDDVSKEGIDAETSFIQDTCNNIGHCIKDIVKTDTFAQCFQRAAGNDKIWAAISKPVGGYLDFVNYCQVKVEKCLNFNRHLVKEDAAKLITILWESNHSKKKYDIEILDDSSDDDDDGEEEKEEEEEDDKGEDKEDNENNDEFEDANGGNEEEEKDTE